VSGELNEFRGRVTKTSFSGGSIECDVSLENGDHLTCRIVMGESADQLKVGQEVSATLDANEILVYPYPRIGLQKEISLE
jgi:molybdopterin-binding protein